MKKIMLVLCLMVGMITCAFAAPVKVEEKKGDGWTAEVWYETTFKQEFYTFNDMKSLEDVMIDIANTGTEIYGNRYYSKEDIKSYEIDYLSDTYEWIMDNDKGLIYYRDINGYYVYKVATENGLFIIETTYPGK